MNQLLVSLIVILLPGIIATIISDKLTTHSKWDSFKFSLYSLILGMAAYVLLQLLVYLFDIIFCTILSYKLIWSHLAIWANILVDKKNSLSSLEICQAVLLALPVALIASYTINYKFFNKIAQKIKVSYKYGDENLFSYYLNTKEIDWVTIRDTENNLTYEGRVISHSENDNIQEIVLSEVTVYRYTDSAELYSIPTIYLSRASGKFVIEEVSKQRFGGGTND